MFGAELQRIHAIIFVRIHFVNAPLFFRLHATNIFQKFEKTGNKTREVPGTAPHENQPGTRQGKGKVWNPRQGRGRSPASAESPRIAAGRDLRGNLPCPPISRPLLSTPSSGRGPIIGEPTVAF